MLVGRSQALQILLASFLGLASCSSGSTGSDGAGDSVQPDGASDTIWIAPREDAVEVWDFQAQDGMLGDYRCEPGQGCFGSPCTDNGQCSGGWCVDHLGEGRCTSVCQEDCPAGWTCQEVSWSYPDILFICLSDFANLCKPCTTSQDCSGVGATQDVCVDYGDEGRFCGGNCGADKPCPEGYQCKADAVTAEGVESSQCVRIEGTCPCSGKSIALASSTPCAVENEHGRCEGLRTCKEEFLGECSAPVPAAEVCDGIDNDCDGELDESTCQDDDPCTDDSCVEGVCQFVPNVASCDDGNPCTIDDKCAEGECAGVPGGCDCQADEDCAQFEDGDVCNGTLICNLEQFPYQCEVASESPVICPPPEGIHAPCLSVTCDPDTGECGLAPSGDGKPCDDENACTVGDQCLEGQCVGGVPANCNDGNPCTDDSCDAPVGCVSTPNQLPCQDGNACTVDDQCFEGACKPGAPLDCDDGNVCSNDFCLPETGCSNAANTLPCDDGNACTTGDVCAAKSCKSGAPVVCDDSNPCTTDSCAPATGCSNLPNTLACDDGNPCTVSDKCAASKCVSGPPLDCNDSNVCTDDSCVSTQQGTPKCIHEPNTAPCGAGYLCSGGTCNCVPNCTGKVCGPDGCGGFCTQGGMPLCEKQKGVCAGAKKAEALCKDGQWLACTKNEYFFHHNAYQDAPETVCDLLDNDCDGLADEELGQLTCGLGACLHTVAACVNGLLQSCDPLQGKTAEKCDGIDNDCNGIADDGLGATSCGLGPCFHSQPNCEAGKPVTCDPLKGATQEKLDGIDNDCDGQTDEGFPVPGTIIITELMVNPNCVVDASGEWVELYNTTDQAWDINGWALKDVDTDNITLGSGAPLVVPAKGYLVVGRNGDMATNGNVKIDYIYSGNNFTLGNSAEGDEVLLIGPGNVEVDKVVYGTALGFPDQNAGAGRSMSLKATAYDPVKNDTGGNWFQANVAISGGCGDKGTPAAVNQ